MIERLLKVRWWDYDIRGWLTRNPETKTIPLTESTLSRIEEAIAAGELRPLRSVRHQINMADGTCTVKTLPP